MSEVPAIKTALGLLHLPASLRRIRTEPLPRDVETLLRIVAGDEDEISVAARLTERPPALIRDAAVFYIEQVLFAPHSDSYRVLAATPNASAQELRRNMALLMSWLHPDKYPAGDRAVFAARVTRAWNDLRSSDRRAAYDATLVTAQSREHRQAPQLRSHRNNNSGATDFRMAPRHSSTRTDDGLKSNLLRRGWELLRRALRPRVSS